MAEEPLPAERMRRMTEWAQAASRHMQTLADALRLAVAAMPDEALKTRYRKALADIEPLLSTGECREATNTAEPQVRHVRSHDSAESGDGIT
jgi:hypothetical protein